MIIVEHDHAALGADIGALRAAGCDQARIAVVPGIANEGLNRVGERHEDNLAMLEGGQFGLLAGKQNGPPSYPNDL
jgi:hypothetical protein